jgi:hypothetical protein
VVEDGLHARWQVFVQPADVALIDIGTPQFGDGCVSAEMAKDSSRCASKVEIALNFDLVPFRNLHDFQMIDKPQDPVLPVVVGPVAFTIFTCGNGPGIILHKRIKVFLAESIENLGRSMQLG